MILIGIGANLPTSAHGSPLETCNAAVAALIEAGLVVHKQSPWYESAPVPASDQPWFINGVVAVDTALAAVAILDRLHRIEEDHGRVRRKTNAPRTLDLDLLDADGAVRDGIGSGAPTLPHPRLHERAFVLLPLRDIDPDWRHPISGKTVDSLIADLPGSQMARRLENSAGSD
jgi:2-amino-4-hydroxy-6-hydroxymethyldihydropteridine diphosphokinase